MFYLCFISVLFQLCGQLNSIRCRRTGLRTACRRPRRPTVRPSSSFDGASLSTGSAVTWRQLARGGQEARAHFGSVVDICADGVFHCGRSVSCGRMALLRRCSGCGDLRDRIHSRLMRRWCPLYCLWRHRLIYAPLSTGWPKMSAPSYRFSVTRIKAC